MSRFSVRARIKEIPANHITDHPRCGPYLDHSPLTLLLSTRPKTYAANQLYIPVKLTGMFFEKHSKGKSASTFANQPYSRQKLKTNNGPKKTNNEKYIFQVDIRHLFPPEKKEKCLWKAARVVRRPDPALREASGQVALKRKRTHLQYTSASVYSGQYAEDPTADSALIRQTNTIHQNI